MITSVKIKPANSNLDEANKEIIRLKEELRLTRNELTEAHKTIERLQLSSTNKDTLITDQEASSAYPTTTIPTPPEQKTPKQAPIGILYEWLDSRFLRGRYGWPDDIRLHPKDKTTTNENKSHLATWEVCKEVVVIPDTQDANCSYANWLIHHAPDEVRGEHALPLVAPATHFISHAWGFEFQHLLRAIRSFVRHTCTEEERNQGIYLWIDIFVVDQHAAARGEMGDDYWETAFCEMVNSIGHTVLVLDKLPALTPTVLTRIWCIWELYSTVSNSNNRLSITMDSEIGNMYKSCKNTQLMKELLIVISAIRSEKAEATVDSDRDKINTLIQATQGGHAEVDKCMRRVLYALLLSMGACTLEDTNKEHLEAYHALSEKMMEVSSNGIVHTQKYHGRSGLVWSLTLDKPNIAALLHNMGCTCEDVTILNMSGYCNTTLDSIPQGLISGQLSSLQSLYLGNHKLNTLPETFGTGLPNLMQLDLSENEFVEIPKTLLDLKQLNILNMANNRLSKDAINNIFDENVEHSQWSLLRSFDLRLNDNLDIETPDLLRQHISSLELVLFHTEPRERAVAILLNSFQSRGDLGLATALDVKEIIDPGSNNVIYYVAMSPGSAMQGWGKKALVANLEMKKAFLTQMGFHRVYWERGGLEKLGSPCSGEFGHPSGQGSRQSFQRGHLNWLPGKGCFFSSDDSTILLKQNERNE